MGNRLLTSLIALFNSLFDGRCHKEFTQILFGGRLLSMKKKTGDIRPIVVGYVWRRLTAKCVNAHAIESYFNPLLVEVGDAGGCETAVHATRRLLSTIPTDNIIVKLHFFKHIQ